MAFNSKSIIQILIFMSILISANVYLFSILAFEINETIIISDDKSTYYIQGNIGSMHASAFSKTHENIERVVLNSTGGFIWDAGILAYYIHKNGLTTVVEENSVCYSACVLLFQAGKNRIAHVNSKFMIHSVQFEANNILYTDPVGTLIYTSLLRLYGFDDDFLNNISIDNGDFYFDAVTAKEYGIVTDLVLD